MGNFKFCSADDDGIDNQAITLKPKIQDRILLNNFDELKENIQR